MKKPDIWPAEPHMKNSRPRNTLVTYGLQATENAARSIGVRKFAWEYVARIISQNMTNKKSKQVLAGMMRAQIKSVGSDALAPFHHTLRYAADHIQCGLPFDMEPTN
jgi:hypothetical protein